MNNLFDTDNYPDAEPTELVIGSRWAWKRSDITDAYPTSLYTLKYVFADQERLSNKIEITASKISNAHVVEVPIATTGTYYSGDYFWKAIVIRDSDSEEVAVSEGHATLKTQSGDIASHTYKVLLAIRAVIEKKASKDQMSYSINGRSLARYTFEDLTKLEQHYTRRWNNEKSAVDRKNGRAGKHRVLTKMGA